MQLSPMMQQYMDIKEKHKDCILFFRLGDFYEMFFEDALVVSKELEITLTGKNCGMEERAPMCGVPFHSADSYIARLVEKDFKVAICEQVEDPSKAKGIVKREVIQIVTPGTVLSQTMLQETENNYLASIFYSEDEVGLAYCDISTGEICATYLTGTSKLESMLNELVKVNAKEVILNEDTLGLVDPEDIKTITQAYFNPLNDTYYTEKATKDAILRQFNIQALNGLGIEDGDSVQKALGSLLLYLLETQKNNLGHITHLKLYNMGDHMSLDKSTIKNLELTETLFEKRKQGSLLGVLDKTHTAMGSRKLKQWIREPLNNVEAINKRLDGVEILETNVLMRNDLKESLKGIYDFERLAGRIACGRANGKDLIALRNSCQKLPEIKEELRGCGSQLLEEIEERIHSLQNVYDLINKAIVEEPSFLLKEGNLIKTGYSSALDELTFSIKDAQNWIAGLESSERERTGVKNIKVGFNKVFGYYLEITKSYYDSIPDNYIRKQTLANCERFITPELKEMESLVLNAETKINQMEYTLFTELRDEIQKHIKEIQETSSAISDLDVLTSFAEVSQQNDYVKPIVNESDHITIERGRHPVIEQTIGNGAFVCNDAYMDTDKDSMLLITGPNMSGKSTYMRQTALLVLMAQAGCFIPCTNGTIGIVDRIFTRIGASDNLAQGQSTFFVEMNELSYILNTATNKSLIILDEIGRGTSTYDGLSIAWAVVEYLCNEKNKIRTLFATHYHELTALEDTIPGFKNLNVDVAEENGDVIFLHKIVEGSASRSYGIHVAKLAGAPTSLLERASLKLSELENKMKVPESTKPLKEKEENQLSFFDFVPNPVIERLKSLDLMELTPSEAFKILEELKMAAK
ncbi:MAG: DNA mismatch repair protein MutS [Anaerovoracaceae bacterium]